MASRQDIAKRQHDAGVLFDDPGVVIAPDPFLDEQAHAIRLLGRRVISDIMEIGGRLIAAKEHCQHGEWLSWLKHEFGWVQQTAFNYMRVAESFGKLPTVSNLAPLDIDATALYALASPAVPVEVRQQAVARAEAGEHITKAEAQRMIEAAKVEGGAEAEDRARKAEAKLAEKTAIFTQAIEDERKKALDVAEAAVQTVMKDLVHDKEKAEAEAAKIRAEAKKPLSLPALEAAILAMPATRKSGKKKLSGDEWRLIAQITGGAIAVGNHTYLPMSKEQVQANEERLRIATGITQAFEALAGAPSPDSMFETAWDVQIDVHRRLVGPVIDWLQKYRKLLEARDMANNLPHWFSVKIAEDIDKTTKELSKDGAFTTEDVTEKIAPGLWKEAEQFSYALFCDHIKRKVAVQLGNNTQEATPQQETLPDLELPRFLSVPASEGKGPPQWKPIQDCTPDDLDRIVIHEKKVNATRVANTSRKEILLRRALKLGCASDKPISTVFGSTDIDSVIDADSTVEVAEAATVQGAEGSATQWAGGIDLFNEKPKPPKRRRSKPQQRRA